MIDWVGQKIGNYRLVKHLGEGAYADVYLGKHIELGTNVAIKVLHARYNPIDRNAFRNEAKIMASLNHPHIISVLDFGTKWLFYPYLIMEYAPKGTLRSRHPRGTTVPVETVILYVKQIASALQYMHDQNLIHRDLKPENLLRGKNRDILLSDFGIADIAHNPLTQKAEFAGTPVYMAPEQILGKARKESDQYALGIIVYELLSGNVPFQGTTIAEVYEQKVSSPPRSLYGRVSGLSRETDQVILRSLAKEPHQRFSSVRAFADALEKSYKKGSSPHKPSREGGIWTFSGHHYEVVHSVAWSPDGKRIAATWNPGERYSDLTGDSKVRVLDASDGRKIFSSHNKTGRVISVAWSPNSKRIACGCSDDKVSVLDAANGILVFTYDKHDSGSVRALAWSPDGTHIASVGCDIIDFPVNVWNAANCQNVYTYRRHTGPVNSVAWSPKGKFIASGSEDTTVQVWHAAIDRIEYTYRRHTGPVNSVAWSPKLRYIASGSEDNTVQVWDAANGQNVYTFRGHTGPVNSVAWSPYGKLIASGSSDNTVQVWDAVTGRNVYTFRGHTDPVNSVAWSPDGTRIASGAGTNIQVWKAV